VSLKCYVDTSGYQVNTSGSSGSIVKDSSGNLWCLYVIGTSFYCRESTDGGITWEDAETVVTESYGGTDGIEFDAAVDSSNIIHVVYRVRTDGATINTLYYIYRDPTTGWSVKEDILGAASYYKHPKVAVDSSDNVHCIYHKGTLGSASVRYVKRTSGVWGSEVLLVAKYNLGTGSGYDAQDICIDGLGYIHVVYEGGSASATTYLYYMLNDGIWQAEETLAGFGDLDLDQRHPSIAVDSSNVVHVVWSGEGHSATYPAVAQVCHIAGNTGAWGSVELVTDTSQPQGWPHGVSFAINDLNEIDICFAGSTWSVPNPTSTTGNHIKYSGGAWGSVEVLSDYNIAAVYGMLWAATPAQCTLASGFIVLMTGDWSAPTVTTQAVTNIIPDTATGNGNITDLGSDPVTQYGVCWNTDGGPTTADSKTEEGAGAVGAFTSSITDLIPGAVYYVRAYATNNAGTSYGSEESFTSRHWYCLSVRGINLLYEDLDETKELHVILENLSPTSKQAGDAGEVVVGVGYEPAA